MFFTVAYIVFNLRKNKIKLWSLEQNKSYVLNKSYVHTTQWNEASKKVNNALSWIVHWFRGKRNKPATQSRVLHKQVAIYIKILFYVRKKRYGEQSNVKILQNSFFCQ